MFEDLMGSCSTDESSASKTSPKEYVIDPETSYMTDSGVKPGKTSDSPQWTSEELEREMIFPNEKTSKRFEEFEFYCRHCEFHIRTGDKTPAHVLTNDHKLLKRV